ncbi:MAG: 3-oxo-tetronate kinase [Pseudomonadota bacterium]
MTVMGCIADDFTGATDLAGLLARSGASVNLRIGVPATPPSDGADFEVIALKCRTEPVADAVKGCLDALSWLQQTGAERFFWKYCSTFDSTAEGNIGPVAEALMRALDTTQTTYCPAFPENGRAIFMGHLFVGEQLLSDSPMKDHPLTPMRQSNLVDLLRPQTVAGVGLANRLVVEKGPETLRSRLSDLKEAGAQHVVVDAVSNDDLEIIAEVNADFALTTGGSAVAMPLPDIFRRRGLLGAADAGTKPATPEGGALVLSGSCSAMTQAQVAEYLKHASGCKLDPLDLAEAGVSAARAWLLAQPADTPKLIYATANPEAVRAAQSKLGVAKAGQLVEDALAELAVLARDNGVRRFVVAGGETSGAVTKALGVDKLTIGAEIAPGVPWTYTRSAGHDIALTLKSGNFGAETFFADALEALE